MERKHEDAPRAATLDEPRRDDHKAAPATMFPPGLPPGVLQRKLAQRRAARDAAAAGASAADAGAGRQLPSAVQSKMEASFGADFSGVRVHEGPQAGAMGAIAYTQGERVHFEPGHYDPESATGQRLLGHELAHVVQQRAGRVDVPQGKDSPINADPSLEAEADRAGDLAAEGRAAGLAGGGSAATAGAAVQRKEGHDDDSEQGHDEDDEQEEVSWTGKHATKKVLPQNQTLGGTLMDVKDNTKAKMLWGQVKNRGKQKKAKKKLRRLMRQHERQSEEWITDDVFKILQHNGFPLEPTEWDIGNQVPKGPLLTNAQMQGIEALCGSEGGQYWLDAAGMFHIDRALAYLHAGKFRDWLRLHPANRLLLSTLAWRDGIGKAYPPSPAYTLARSIQTGRNSGLEGEEKEQAKRERDGDIREAFVNTLMSPDEDKTRDIRTAVRGGAIKGKKSTKQVFDENRQATEILKRIFLILQAGLKVYDKDKRDHVDYKEGDVCRALGHGGRVNIRIPALKLGQWGTGYELTDWIGLTRRGNSLGGHVGSEAKGPVFSRAFGTHHMKMMGRGRNSPMIEEGESGANTHNMGDPLSFMFGMNVGAGGMGNKDFNGDVILPDGGHGHLFVGLKLPTPYQDGALQVGFETTGPGAPNPVGYKHTAESSEATANPESSFYGHKQDKIGDGSPRKVKGDQTEELDPDNWRATNARYVDLYEVGDKNQDQKGDWLGYLETLRKDWLEPLEKTGERGAMQELVGPRQF